MILKSGEDPGDRVGIFTGCRGRTILAERWISQENEITILYNGGCRNTTLSSKLKEWRK